MSEVETQATDILLPSASISVFSMDEDTLKSAATLKDDWRFARVTTEIVNGDVEAAIKAFEGQGATDLVIIQTDKIDDSFTERLGEFSNYCDENTAAIIIGPVNDVYLYRSLIEMGVNDYLVRPVSPEILIDVISKALINRLGMSDSCLIAFLGAKGGVGTSIISQIAATIVSQQMEQKILLLDASGGCSSLSVGMGFDPAATMTEIAKAVEVGNEDALARMFIEVEENLTVSASGSDSMLDAPVPAAQFEAVLDNLMVKYPIVMVDLSSADPCVKKAVIARAHQVNLITTPTVTSLRFSRSLLREISAVRGENNDDISLIVNKVGMVKANEVESGDIEEALEIKAAASIDNDPALFVKYESEVKGFISDKDAMPVATALLPILQKYISSSKKEELVNNDKSSGILGGFLSKMKSK